MAVKRPRVRYTFLEDKSAPQLKAALIMAGLSLLCLLILIVHASFSENGAGPASGAAALAAMLVSWYAFAVSMKELAKRPVNIRLAAASAGLTGLLAIIWLALLLAGIKRM